MLQFCPSCDGLLRVKPVEGTKVLYCPKCEKSFPVPGRDSTPVSVDRDSPRVREKIARAKAVVVDEDSNLAPTSQQQCPQCGHDTAFFFEMPPL